ncbi:MAG: adenylate/guanylate cyclase domain-containing protein [bacterium]|nr:adenylate/guanylate cyclase domain-containing protein [bacterium]
MFKRIFGFSGFKIALLITLALSAHYLFTLLGFNPQSFMSLVDKKVVDLVQANRGGKQMTPQIAIAAIDTKSVDKYGRWPWPRNVMADLLEVLGSHYDVKVVGYDAVFSEPDPNDQTTKQVIRRYSEELRALDPTSKQHLKEIEAIEATLNQELAFDAAFAEKLTRWADRVVNGYFFFANEDRVLHLDKTERARATAIIEPSAIKVIRGINHLEYTPLYEVAVVESNIEALSPPGIQAGFFNVFPDAEDGTVRRVHLVLKHEGRLYPSLDLQILSRYLGDAQISMLIGEAGVQAFKVGDRRINTASDGSVMINYRGPAFSFPHYSVWDLIHKTVPKAALQGKIVLLGATEVGVFDLRTTPVGVDFPGVEVHANLLDNLLQGDYFNRSEFTNFLTLIVILATGLFVGLVLPRLGALPGALFVICLSGGFFYGNYWYLENKQTWISFVYVLSVILLNWLVIMLWSYFSEEKDKRFIKGAFGQYLAPQVIDQLVHNPNLLKLGGERREITAFFSDVQGFSTISETLEPEELVGALNEYLTAMTDIIMNHGGTVDKFEGDAIIAFFGAPVPQEDHAKRACDCSLKMQEKLGEMRAHWKSIGKPELYMRIGLNTSVAVVGNMGSAQRMDYTMMGDGVNLAARLEGVNKQYGTFTLISENTQAAIGEAFELRELDLIRVVGKQEPIRIFELVGHPEQLSEEAKQLNRYFAKALILYRRQEWKEAAKYFLHYAKQNPEDRSAQVFVERCKFFLKNPPPKDWDGVYQMTSK